MVGDQKSEVLQELQKQKEMESPLLISLGSLVISVFVFFQWR